MKRMKLIIAVGLLFVGFTSYGQYSIGGGVSTLFQFGNNKPFAGLHLVAEFPRNNEVTFFVRANYLFKQKLDSTIATVPVTATNINTNPYTVNVPYNSKESYNYFMIDGGTRYYIINGYDEGFSLYGGTSIGVAINSVKYNTRIGDYDKSKYDAGPDSLYNVTGNGVILNLAVGLSGGAKYTIPGRGTFYFDVNPTFMVLGMPSNPDIQSNLYKKLVFTFNIGYRREFY